METRKLILIRGVSGSGKSTIASHCVSQSLGSCSAFEADRFFETLIGYKFDANKLSQAHNWCRINTEKEMFGNMPIVIVANTSMTHWELEPYIALALEYRYALKIWRTPGPWKTEVLFKRNLHNVPLEVLEKQIRKYKPYPGEEEWTDLSVFPNERRK